MAENNEHNEPNEAQQQEEQQAFTIQCRSGHEVAVSNEEATKILAGSDYFRNAFRHGTVETEHRILCKPDWTRDVARKVVRLLGRPNDYSTSVQAGSTPCRNLFAALDQLALPVEFVYEGAYHHNAGPSISRASPEDARHLTLTLSEAKDLGVVRCRMDTVKWTSLLEHGILFARGLENSDDETLTHVLHPSLRGRGGNLGVKCTLTVPRDDCNNVRSICGRLYSKHEQVETIAKIFQVFEDSLPEDTIMRNQVILSIKFKARELAMGMVSRSLLSPSDDLFSPVDNTESVFLRLEGTFESLFEQIRLFEDTSVESMCVLLLHPDMETLQAFVTAARLVFPGTMGVDMDRCSVFLKKPAREIKTVFEHILGKRDNAMLVFGSPSRQDGVF